MNKSGKVRLLLLLLFTGLVMLALSVKVSYNSENLLSSSALTLQKNLNDKEAFVEDFLSKPANITTLKNLAGNEQDALKLIKSLTKSRKLYFSTYHKNKLVFWSSSRIVPDSAADFKNGTSFIRANNGEYELYKKADGDFTVLFFIPVKTAYKIQNQYLNNNFSVNLLNNNYVDIATAQDKQAVKITSLHHQTLFYIKLKPVSTKSYLDTIKSVLWCLSALVLFVLVYSCCTYLADKGHVKLAVLLAALFVILCIGINFFLHQIKYSPINKEIPVLRLNNVYAAFFSIQDIAWIILFITWFSVFVYSNRGRLNKPVISPIKSYFIFLLMALMLVGFSVIFSSLFSNLIADSRIQFDIDNLLSLTFYNFLGSVMLCLSYLIFYLIGETFIVICTKLNIPDQRQLFVFGAIILLTTIIHYYTYQYFTFFYLLWSAVVAWRAYNVFYENGKMPAIGFVAVIALSSLIATIKLAHIQSKLETENKYTKLEKLVNTVDSDAEYSFRGVEKKITEDPKLTSYFSNPGRNEVYLKNHLRNLYFDDYLSRYNLKVYAYDNQHHNISGQQDYELDVFKSMIELGSVIKVDSTRFFNRSLNAFGIRQYFALIPIKSGRQLQGTLIVDLQSKGFENNHSFPPLLRDEKFNQQNNSKTYSYAFYMDNKLLGQSGNFDYNLTNTRFKGKLNHYIEAETTDPNYSHLIYQPNERKLIIVSVKDKGTGDLLSTFIFFFVLFLAFTLLITAAYWFWSRAKDLNLNHFLWSLQVAANNLLYKTRIQISMVTSVVFTLMIIGVVTYFMFDKQDKNQQDDLNHEKIKHIAEVYKAEIMDSKIDNQEELELRFNDFAETNSVDLILYDTCGVPVLYTQPKLYSYGLIYPRMNATAFINMKHLQKSEFLNDEEIGKFNYRSAYIPIRNAENKVVNFMQLPYFSDEAEYNRRVSYFVNSMLNAYALVLVAIGLFAVFIAKRITNPLNLIQQGLTNTVYGRKTEPINWKRNDEIGSLIKEYNKMIVSLELSANKLAKSERENAWREMAKQIAHEIKNPLTPLKLGLQLLSKAWKDKDQRFDEKFQKFSYSFIEQIETLSRIATEFSDFARLPDAKPEVVNIFSVISSAINIFNQSDNLRIEYNPSTDLYLIRADKDQLLRCFNNLLKNAIEAMPENHKGVISITYQVTVETILINLKDNGNGIPENVRSNIFQPNFTTKSSGTGLGLAFIKTAIENADGKIWFETETGIGTSFHLLFPSASKNFL